MADAVALARCNRAMQSPLHIQEASGWPVKVIWQQMFSLYEYWRGNSQPVFVLMSMFFNFLS
jgi:hypothetical protein